MSKVTVNDVEYQVKFLYDFLEIEEGTIVYSGTTVCRIFIDNKQVAYGHSECNPHDTFVKKVGRTIALTRALKQLKVDRNIRVVFWKILFPQYFRS